MKPTNADRVERARIALDAYRSANGDAGEDLGTDLGDLLADLRHLAAAEGADFDLAVCMSEIHFDEEAEEEGSHA